MLRTRQGRARHPVTRDRARRGRCRHRSVRTVSRQLDGRGIDGRIRVPDDGSASVLLLAVLAVAAVLAGTLALTASARALGAATSSAADLAALAGAQAAAAPWTGAVPCTVAAEAATRNGAEIVTCEVDGLGVVEVTVRRPPRGALARVAGPRTATARAGPDWVRDAEQAGAR